MTFQNHLLNRLKAAEDGASDYKLSKILGVSPQCISNVRKGRNGLKDQNLMKIADLLDMDRVTTVARAHIEGESTHEMRMLWGEILRRSDAATDCEVIEFKEKASA